MSRKPYHNSAHLVYSCQYHVIFCPKYRRKVLCPPIDARAKGIFLVVAKENDFSILEMEVMPDHVHLLIDCNPRFGIVNAVKKLKATSSHILREEFPELQRRISTLWTRSYFVSSVGSVSLDVVKRYIESQKGK